MATKIRFKRQYKPVGFGNPPCAGTVDGKRLSAIRAGETRRLSRLQRDLELKGPPYDWWLVRFRAFLAWGLTHMKFRSGKAGE